MFIEAISGTKFTGNECFVFFSLLGFLHIAQSVHRGCCECARFADA